MAFGKNMGELLIYHFTLDLHKTRLSVGQIQNVSHLFWCYVMSSAVRTGIVRFYIWHADKCFALYFSRGTFVLAREHCPPYLSPFPREQAIFSKIAKTLVF